MRVRPLLAMLVIVVAATVSFAQDSHVVRKGDTLWGLARKYHVSVSELRRVNGLSPGTLRIGTRLNIPGRGVPPRVIAGSRYEPRHVPPFRSFDGSLLPDRDAPSPEDLACFEETVPTTDVWGALEGLAQGIDFCAGTPSMPGPAPMPEPSQNASLSLPTLTELRDIVLGTAAGMLDVPYRFGGNSILGIDCSAFVQTVFERLNLLLPRTAREQFRLGEKVERDELSPGDLVFFRTYASFPSHVGIYVGHGLFIHASSKRLAVRVDPLDSPYYVRRFIGARRILPN